MIVVPSPGGDPAARRTRVKFCGITRPQDAVHAAMLGVDALGVVFAPSPRRVEIARAIEILDAAPGAVQRVGVFGDQGEAFIREAARRCRLDWIQLSGRTSRKLAASLPARLIKTIHVKGSDDLAAAARYPAEAFLLDAPPLGDRMGGRGVTFDWSRAETLPWPRWRVIVAGGLTPGNVGEAIRRLRPGGVDVSSGIEASPGIKDRGKMEAFLAAVGLADARLRETAAAAEPPAGKEQGETHG